MQIHSATFSYYNLMLKHMYLEQAVWVLSMSAKKYRIVYKGELLDGQRLEAVREKLATVFRLNSAQVESLFSGKPVVVKQGLDEPAARKFHKIFSDAGARCRIYKEKPEEEAARPSPPPQTVEDQVTCHKCGHQQPRADECSKCGVIFSKLEKIEKQKKNIAAVLSPASTGAVLYQAEQPPEAEDLVAELEKLRLDDIDGRKAFSHFQSMIRDEPGFWPAWLKMAEILSKSTDKQLQNQADHLLESASELVDGGRPEIMKLRAELASRDGDEKGTRIFARQAHALYQQLHQISGSEEQLQIEEEVRLLLNLAGIGEKITVVSPNGKILLDTEDEAEIFAGRKSGSLPPGSLVVENGMGEGTPLKDWRKPGLFSINFQENPVMSRALVIDLLFGIAGLIFFFDDSLAFLGQYFSEVGDAFLEGLRYAFLPMIALVIMSWQISLIILSIVLVCTFGFGFVVGVIAGFLPSLLISLLLHPLFRGAQPARQ